MADLTFRYLPKLNFFIFLFCLTLLTKNSYQDIVGCGGFLKSSVSIDFSRVEIKLYTKQGTLKESSDCAPTNGYYFIPIYDKGEYVLKIEPPENWSFQPKEVPLNFDGVNDPCSKGKDINFEFKGFGIVGKVNSAGSMEGPENVKVTLVSDLDKSPLKLSASTKEGGQFQFTPILPGKYSLKAEHEKYKFLKNSVTILMKEENYRLPLDSLVIAGYDIIGKVFFNGEPTVGVKFVLSANDERNGDVKPSDCSKTPLADFEREDYVCHVTSDENGSFRFVTVPSGNYTIRPHYVKFDVQPKELNVIVKHDHVILGDKFLVKGFRVSGRVLTSAEGYAFKNVEIYLNGKRVAVTDGEGRYVLDGMEPGTYELSARAENVKFEVLTVKLTPNSPEIENLYPSEFKVCGLVSSASVTVEPKLVEIKMADEPGKTTEAIVDRDTGKFCLFLKRGNYNLAVKLSDSETSSGMQYLPLTREVRVQNNPISDIEFSQLRGNIYGRVIKLPESKKPVEMSVKLKSKNSLVALKVLEGNNLSYAFNEVMPGFYDVEVENDLWCFRDEFHAVSVASAETVVPDFVQTGFRVKVKSSHRTSVTVTNDASGSEFRNDLILERGENTVCLPLPGSYRLTPVGCHGYEKESYLVDSANGGVANLNAVSHDVTGYVGSPLPESDVKIEVTLPDGQTIRLDLAKSEKTSGGFVREFRYRAKENQLLKFRPISDQLLFRPETIEHRTTNDCSNGEIRFEGEKGRVLEGGINPPLENVRVNLKIKNGSSGSREELNFVTKADGKYKFGPMRSTSDYELTAEKESYAFSGPDRSGIFNAHKLAEINVKVIDNATNEPLRGVLLSLTGGEKQYRRNSATEDDGFLSFHSLGPGEYFLRPMMKEYKFEPSSQIIQVQEGVAESVELRGRRVSFSAYGTIGCLNGEPETNVIVEAVGTNACSNLVEEASSEANGQFRIRGLLPQCEYRIRLKTGPDVNVRIHRLEPSDLSITTNKGDVRGIELIAFHAVNQMDLSVHVESSIPEHLKSLKLKLFKDAEPDSPVYTVKLDTLAGGAKHWGNAACQERFLKAGLLVQFPFVPRDKTSYYIQVESNLNKHAYSYRESTLRFVADKTYRNIKINFEPALKTIDHELTHTNYVIVPLLVFAALFYAYFNKAVPAIQNFFATINQTSFSFARDEKNYYGHGNAMENVSIEPVVVSTKRKTKPRKA